MAATPNLLLLQTPRDGMFSHQTQMRTPQESRECRSGCRAAANSVFGEVEEELFVEEVAMSQEFDPPPPLLSLTDEKC